MFAGRLLAIFVGLSGLLSAQPVLTTIQDTLYKADGSRFNGSAVITWKTFEAGDTSNIGTQSVTVPILSGAFRVQLVPNTNAKPVNNYTVRYSSDGKEQFSEMWAVPPSVRPLRVRDVRIDRTAVAGSGGNSGGGGGGAVTPPAGQTPILEADVVGLVSDLTLRPVKGPGFGPGRSAVINAQGEVESVVGTPDDCVHVDGTSGPCFDPTNLASFTDAETPAGIVDGSNAMFALANAPSPGSSLALYRNGLFQKQGFDYTLTNKTIQFATPAIPQPSDTLMASYRSGGNGGAPTRQINTKAPLAGGGTLDTDLTLSLTDSAFLRRGHKAMVVGDSQAGGFTADYPFPSLAPNWFTQAIVSSRSSIRYHANAGALGSTSGDVLGRFDRDVIARNPDKVFIIAGFADVDYVTPVEQIAANINEMVNRLKAANILPIVCTLPPRVPVDIYSENAPHGTYDVVKLNLKIRKIADTQGIPLVDFYTVLVDPATGLYKPGYAPDRAHPVMPATKLMAAVAVAATKDIFDPTYPWLPTSDNDSINLLSDSIFLQNPTTWSSAVVSGSTPLQLAAGSDPGIIGKTMTLTKTDAASENTFSGPTVTAGFAPGDRLAFAGRIKSQNVEAGNLVFDVQLHFDGVTSGPQDSHPMLGWSVDIQDGQWYVELTVPPGATAMRPIVLMHGGTGSITLGQVGIINLTANAVN